MLSARPEPTLPLQHLVAGTAARPSCCRTTAAHRQRLQQAIALSGVGSALGWEARSCESCSLPANVSINIRFRWQVLKNLLLVEHLRYISQANQRFRTVGASVHKSLSASQHPRSMSAHDPTLSCCKETSMMPMTFRDGHSSATKHRNLHTVLCYACTTTGTASMQDVNDGVLCFCSLVLCRIPQLLLQRCNDLATEHHPRDTIDNRPRPSYRLVEPFELDEGGRWQL